MSGEGGSKEKKLKIKKKRKEKENPNRSGQRTPYRKCGDQGDFPDTTTPKVLLIISYLAHSDLKNRGLIPRCVSLWLPPSFLRTPYSILHSVPPYDHFRLSRVWSKAGAFPYLSIWYLWRRTEEEEGLRRRRGHDHDDSNQL